MVKDWSVMKSCNGLLNSFMNFKSWLLSEAKHSFSSTQVNLPDELRDKVLQWSKEHIKDSDLYVEEDDYGREEESHVTVLFGLHADNAKKLSPKVKSFKKFEMTLGNIEKFSSEKFDVIHIHIKSPEICSLNAALKSLPHTNTHKNYSPHCTLAYVKKGSCDHLLGKCSLTGLKVPANTVLFSNKDREKTAMPLS